MRFLIKQLDQFPCGAWDPHFNLQFLKKYFSDLVNALDKGLSNHHVSSITTIQYYIDHRVRVRFGKP